MSDRRALPLVYSCSGASSAAQMANHIAVKLDPLKVAEMSCIAGVGGDVKPLVRTAKSGRPIMRAGDDSREPSSPVCYLNEFQDW